MTAPKGEDSETILEVGGAGGSLSILRRRTHDGAWRFIVSRDESTFAGLLDPEDLEGLSLTETSEPLETLAAALQVLDRYPWHLLMPLKLHREYAAAVVTEVVRRGGPKEAARWKTELSRRLD